MSIPGVPEQPDGPFVPLLESPAIEGLPHHGHAISNQHKLQLSRDDSYTPPPEIMKADIGIGLTLLFIALGGGGIVGSTYLGLRHLFRVRGADYRKVSKQLEAAFIENHAADDAVRYLASHEIDKVSETSMVRADNDEYYFQATKDDRDFVFPYLATRALGEWHALSEKERLERFGQRFANINGTLPSSFISAVMEREMGDAWARERNRTLAPVYYQLTHARELGYIDYVSEYADVYYPFYDARFGFEAPVKYSLHLIEMWGKLSEDIKTAFGPMTRGMFPGSFFEFMKPIAYLHPENFVEIARALINDWNRLPVIEKRKWWLLILKELTTPELPVRIPMLYVRDWNRKHPVTSIKPSGDSNDNGTPAGSPPAPATPAGTEGNTGAASRIAAFRRGVGTALTGIRTFFSPQIQMPNPVLVPVNVMPLGAINPLMTVI